MKNGILRRRILITTVGNLVFYCPGSEDSSSLLACRGFAVRNEKLFSKSVVGLCYEATSTQNKMKRDLHNASVSVLCYSGRLRSANRATEVDVFGPIV